jgi:hypothetical protein
MFCRQFPGDLLVQLRCRPADMACVVPGRCGVGPAGVASRKPCWWTFTSALRSPVL